MRRRDAIAPVMLALAVGACEWFSTMSDPPGYQPHEIEPIAPPPGAVPLGGLPQYDLATADAVLPPAPAATAEGTRRGEAYYRTFCVVCHDANGMGKGPISDLFPAIPAIATDRVAGLSDPYLFALIAQGRGLMPSYGRIPPAARWEIVHYLRTMRAGAPAPADTAAQAPAGAPADTTAAGSAP